MKEEKSNVHDEEASCCDDQKSKPESPMQMMQCCMNTSPEEMKNMMDRCCPSSTIDKDE